MKQQIKPIHYLTMEFIINETTVLQTLIWQNAQNLRLNMGGKDAFAFIRGALKAFSLLKERPAVNIALRQIMQGSGLDIC